MICSLLDLASSSVSSVGEQAKPEMPDISGEQVTALLFV
jgi:hypothetical protein